jgi:hypothetical protein
VRRLTGREHVAAVLLFAILLGAQARADEEKAPPHRGLARLRYTRARGAERCPDERTLARAVASRLGYDPFRDQAPRTVVAYVRASGGALQGTVTLIDAAGTASGDRRLVAAGGDCAELVASMALAISIAIDPVAALRTELSPRDPAGRPPSVVALPGSETPSGAGAPTAGPEPAPKGRASELRRPAIEPNPLPALLDMPEPPRRAPLRGHVGIGVVGAAGAAPGVAGGAVVEGGLHRREFSVSLEARADFPTTTNAPGRGRASAALFTGSLVPCWNAAAVAACALGSLGALRGSGAGVPHQRQDVTAFAAVGLRLGVELPLAGVFSAAFHGDLAATLLRTALQIDGRDVWTTPRASAALGAVVRAHFP